MYYIIYQTAFIGDIILATSMVRSIKRIDNSGKIIFITTPAGKEILRNNGEIEKIIVYDKRNENRGLSGLLSIVSRIREIIKGEDSVYLSPHRFIRAAIIGSFLGSGVRIGFKNSSLSFLYNRIVPYRYGIHEIERNHELLKSFFMDTLTTDPDMPALYPSANDYKTVRGLIYSSYNHEDGIVAIAPGSIWPTKKWPLDYFSNLIELLKRRDIKVVLIGGNEDFDICLKLESENALNLAGKLSVLESAAALTLVKTIITNDSAPQHIASAMNVPAVVIFGATIPYQGFVPLSRNSVVVQSKGLQCRPCGRHGGKRCKMKHFKCMRDIEPEIVFEHVMEIFGN